MDATWTDGQMNQGVLTHVALGTVFHHWQLKVGCSWKQRKGVTECEHYKILFYSSMGPTGPCLPPFFHISLHFPPSPVSLLAFFLLLYLLPELILLEPFIMYHFFESGIIISWENKTHHVWLWIQIWTFWRKDSVIFFLWLFKSS